jgi:stage III sporulation protein AA
MKSKSLDVILDKLPENIRAPLTECRPAYEDSITELTLRSGRPVCVYRRDKLMYVTQNGLLTDHPLSDQLLKTEAKDIENIVLKLCDYSLYAYQNEINSGFITIGNGVRAGICGTAVINGDRITNIRDISSINFRVARDVKGCSAELLSKIDPLRGVLICGEPSSGKSTLIRDTARELSYKYRVSLIDERRELSASSRGVFGYDLGLCDVFSGYPKSVAVVSAVRSMAPDIIVCDEIGEESDIQALSYSMRCGAAFIATVHASSMDDLRTRKAVADMIELSAFRYIAFLSGRAEPGKIDKIYEMRDGGA